MATIRKWIQDCVRDHPLCHLESSGSLLSTDQKLPFRVIDVRTCGRCNNPPRLLETDGQHGRYVALSHCWGGGIPIMTTRDNLEEYKVAINFSALPQNFRDAIVVTRSLGVHYLWIDALCIVQDDPADWEREAEGMGSLYERAYCVIAASSAANANEGCFIPRTEERPVRLPCTPGTSAQGTMYISSSFPEAAEELDNGPLNNRAWVLQERTLSRRIVHFARSQTIWTCKQSAMDESGATVEGTFGHLEWTRMPRLSNANLNLETPATNQHGTTSITTQENLRDPSYFHGAWFNTVKRYTTLGITYPSDRLPALKGLASVMQNRTGIPYFYGHWMDENAPHFFVHSLLWHPAGTESLTTPGEARCPSWSWAALDGPVDFLRRTGEFTGDRVTTWLEDVRMLSGDDAGTTPFSLLSLRGYITQLSRFTTRGPHDGWPVMVPEGTEMRCYRIATATPATKQGVVCFDLDRLEPEDFLCVPVFEAKVYEREGLKATREWLILIIKEEEGKGEAGGKDSPSIPTLQKYSRIGLGLVRMDTFTDGVPQQEFLLV